MKECDWWEGWSSAIKLSNPIQRDIFFCIILIKMSVAYKTMFVLTFECDISVVCVKWAMFFGKKFYFYAYA